MSAAQAKRLRGWSLQKEMAAPASSSTSQASTPQSALATKLLSLWAHGLLAAVVIQEIAHLAILDGANHPELAAIAKTGNFGQLPGNVSRDIMTTFCNHVDVAEHIGVEVPCIDPKSGEEENVLAGLFLPHMMFYTLATHYWDQFKLLFAIENLEKFWSGTEATGDDRLLGHPIQSVSGWKQKCIPLFMHADGVQFQTRDTLLAWSWGGLLALFHSLDCQLLLCFFPKSCTATDTWAPMMKWLVWSFKALLSGLHPDCDPDNRPLKKESVFYKYKGQQLAPGGYHGVLWSIQGDHEMFSNVLKLPHWRNFNPCWECDCTQSTGPADKHYNKIQPMLQNWVLVDNAEATANPRSNHHIFEIPGLTTRFVRGDALHILWHNGIYSHFLGSILHHMCFSDPPGRPQRVDPSTRLAIIFREVQKAYTDARTPTRLTNLKLSMFCKKKAPFAQHPALSAKAGESKHFALALLQVCKEVLDKGSAVDQHIVRALQNICEVVALFDATDIFLTDKQSSKALNLALAFLDDYAWLHNWAESQDKNLFHTGPLKFHTFYHLVLNSKFMNPRFHWTFRNEDFVGRISTLTHSVSMGVRSTKLSLKACSKYRVLLHLRITRHNFGSLPMIAD
jgi:hypothetical protein